MTPPPQIDLTACDREPIHIPGSIQPHGMMLVADPETLTIRHAAGEVEARLGVADWLGRPLADVIGPDLATAAAILVEAEHAGLLGRLAASEPFDVSLQRAGPWVLIELEPAPVAGNAASSVLSALDAAAAGFERTTGLKALCEAAAIAFRALTGFDRVMVYRFLDDDAGAVLGEARRDDLASFMNHHFPGSDIPRQARALYVRNLIRVIPDASYTPAPLRPAWAEAEPLDLSDAALRSVSPIHLQYLRNMGVVASASMSIVKDGLLWGLIACHNQTPRRIDYDTRIACRALASGLARQIKAKEDAEVLRERIRMRGYEDDIVALLSREGALDDALSNHIGELRRMMAADGVAVLRGGELIAEGVTPSEAAIRDLSVWTTAQGGENPVFATDRLPGLYPPAEAYRAAASGVLALSLSADEPWTLLWFRAEEVEVVEWAGNPHKDPLTPDEMLSPRASFDAWREAVHGRSRRWTLAEVESAGRLRPAVLAVRQNRRIRDLNTRLTDALTDKDLLLQQKEFLVGEINHRVQNSLQLVSSFLALQAKDADDPAFKAAVEEARRRLTAVALVHRRLYRGDHIEMVDVSRYIDELCVDTLRSMGPEWTDHVALDLAPLKMPTDRAVTVGLILTELLINANKYAYDGEPGPLDIRLAEHRDRLRLIVADRGRGQAGTDRKGFGSRMMQALVGQLDGELTHEDNAPGLRVTLSAPLETPQR